jgi:flagellar motor switch protein FliG
MPIQQPSAPLNKLQKAAILLLELGLDSSTEFMQKLSPRTFQALVAELQALGDVRPEQRRAVIREFTEELSAMGESEPLEGRQLVSAVLRRTVEQEQYNAIDLLHTADADELLDILQSEHPQVAAFVLAYIPARQSSALMTRLGAEQQRDMALRIATLRPPDKETLHCFDRVLYHRLTRISGDGPQTVGGVEALVEIIQDAGRNTERTVFEGLSEAHPELVSKMKKLMFTFDDIARINNQDFQKILRQIEGRTLALALKKASEEIVDLVMRNLSERARSVLASDMDAMGRVRVSEVEKAQQEVVETVRGLIAQGEIKVAAEGETEEEMV